MGVLAAPVGLGEPTVESIAVATAALSAKPNARCDFERSHDGHQLYIQIMCGSLLRRMRFQDQLPAQQAHDSSRGAVDPDL